MIAWFDANAPILFCCASLGMAALLGWVVHCAERWAQAYRDNRQLYDAVARKEPREYRY